MTPKHPSNFPTPKETEVDRINGMSREEMASLWRFAPPGHQYFDKTLPYFEIFERRFAELGGFSPAISKAIGFDR